MLGDFELRFFEIYRSAQYLELLARGATTSGDLNKFSEKWLGQKLPPLPSL